MAEKYKEVANRELRTAVEQVWHGLVWFGAVQYGTAWCGMGSVWYVLVLCHDQ